jgi:hypothetical protein
MKQSTTRERISELFPIPRKKGYSSLENLAVNIPTTRYYSFITIVVKVIKVWRATIAIV